MHRQWSERPAGGTAPATRAGTSTASLLGTLQGVQPGSEVELAARLRQRNCVPGWVAVAARSVCRLGWAAKSGAHRARGDRQIFSNGRLAWDQTRCVTCMQRSHQPASKSVHAYPVHDSCAEALCSLTNTTSCHACTQCLEQNKPALVSAGPPPPACAPARRPSCSSVGSKERERATQNVSTHVSSCP
jgi:hypothetical protein